MNGAIDPKKTYLSLATVVAIMAAMVGLGVFAASIVWRASGIVAKVDATAKAVEPIPQLKEDVATLLERTKNWSTASGPSSLSRAESPNP